MEKKDDSDLQESGLELNNNYTLGKLLIEILIFLIFCVLLAGILFGIFYVIIGWDAIFDNLRLIQLSLLYPCLLIAFLVWVKFIKKLDFKFMLGRPKIPDKGHQWFYVLTLFTVIGIIAVGVIVLATGIVMINISDNLWLLDFVYGVFGAGIVEEIIFRGYLYHRSEKIYGENRFYIEWFREKAPFKGEKNRKTMMTFEITYAAMLSSFFFGLYHLPYLSIHIIATMFGGLLACKFRNEWQSLIPGMVLHGGYNGWLKLSEFAYFNPEMIQTFPFIEYLPITILIPAACFIIVIIPFILYFIFIKLRS